VSAGDADKVFVKGAPRCRTLRKDLEAADIPYVDGSGRSADFHSLRYTFNTWMRRKGFVPRVAQELMRHYDRRLTDKVYTDTNLLPLQQSMRNISEDAPLMHILMHICGKTCQEESRVVASDQSSETTETSVTVEDRQELSQSDDSETLVEVAGVETGLAKLLICSSLQHMSLAAGVNHWYWAPYATLWEEERRNPLIC
jgi:hypothetical protein